MLRFLFQSCFLFSFAISTAAQLKVVIIPFHNESALAKNDWLSAGFSEAIGVELGKDTSIDVIERADILAEMKTKGYKTLDMKDEQKALSLARALEANRVILGLFDVTGENVKVLSKFYDTRTGFADVKNSYLGTGTFTTANVYAMYAQIANKALVSFGKKTIDEIGGPTKGAVNVEAFEPYIKGILQYDISSSVEDYTKAIEFFAQAVAKDSNYALAYAGMSRAYAKIGRIQDINFKSEEKTASYNEALKAGLKATKLDKSLASAWTSLALSYRETKDRDQLIQAARRATILRKNQYDAFDMLADAFSGNFFPAFKNLDSAIFYRKKSVEFNPKFASGFRGLGTDYYDKGDYKNAEEMFLKAIAVNPKHAGSRDRLGLVYYAKGDYVKAKQNFQEAIKLDSKTAFGYTHLGDVLMMEGKYKEAISSYDSALAYSSNAAFARNNLAWVLISAKDKTSRNPLKAVENAEVAVSASGSKNAAYLYTLAETYYSNNQSDKAASSIALAIGLDSANADYLETQKRFAKSDKKYEHVFSMWRGNLFFKQGRTADGVKEFEEADKASPKNVFVLFTLAKYYDSQKQCKKAFETYFQARSCDWDKKYKKEIQERMTALEGCAK